MVFADFAKRRKCTSFGTAWCKIFLLQRPLNVYARLGVAFLAPLIIMIVNFMTLESACVRYFNYISAYKVEMLYPQIPHSFWENTKREVTLSFLVVSGKLTKVSNRAEALTTKALAV